MRQMRRIKQLLSEEETLDILKKGTSGVLALQGDEGYPYALPISYVYADHKLYFHCAKSGHKIDAIKRSEKASFCVIQQDKIMPEEYTTYFRSVIAFGKIRIIEDDAAKRQAILLLSEKYHPTGNDHETYINKEYDRFCMLEFTIEQVTGKEAIELVRQKIKK